MDLADFLAAQLEHRTYRELEASMGVSRGSLEAIVKRQNTTLPKIETLTRIARAFHKPLWEVMRMAGVDLGLPQDKSEAGERMAALVARVPELASVVAKLQQRYDTDPDFVVGVLIGLEASLGPSAALPG